MLTAEMCTTLLECLRLPGRAWTCAQLAEVVQPQYGMAVCIETMRPFPRRAGFVWQRTRYVLAKRPDPQEYADAQEDLAILKRGLCGTRGMGIIDLWMRRGAA